MNHLNSILVEGNLVRDPNLHTTPSGNQVCDFTLATNRSYKIADQKYENEVSYFDVEAWARLGTTCAQNLKKGRGVRVVGRLKQDRWTDMEGKSHARVKIVAEHVEFKPQAKSASAIQEKQQLEGSQDFDAQGTRRKEVAPEAVF
ncbi:MAG: single-stranded DNA-binding protein [Rectinema sp.]|nr:single-stranded DNA-binding protein [Rectinema sp.]